MTGAKFSRLFVLLIFLAVPFSVQAQFLGNLNGVTITLTPEYPSPNQDVIATVRSGNVDVSSSTVVWLIDEEIIKQGPGETSFAFKTSGLGEAQQLTVLVRTISDQVLSDTVVIQPSSVTLLWEARTFTPPFYKGRALYTSGSTIRAQAQATIKDANGRIYEPEELIYTWRRNDSVLGERSGLGRSTLTIEGPKFFSNDILSVEVSSPDRARTATSASLIETRDALVLLYEEDPLIGVTYHRSVETDHVFREATQIAIHAVPFYMAAQNADDGSLSYSWKVNGTNIETNVERPSYMTLSPAATNDFSAQASVSIEHFAHLLQEAAGDWLFHFEGGARSTPFGF